jgi:mxaJ protein
VAGYFAPSQAVPLTITKLSAPSDGPQLPMAWDVSMGVRKSDQALKTEVEAVLDREQAQIAKLLRDYGVP